jgi:xanthine permease XanP
MGRIGAWLAAALGRGADRRPRPPAGLVYWLDGRPSIPTAFVLSLQHLAVQSVYFVIPVATAGYISTNTSDVTRFLALSILAAALWQILQVLTRGLIGSGYPIPATHATAVLGAYMLARHGAGGFGVLGATMFLTGLAACVVTFMMHRLRVLLPNEVAGAVVILIGVALTGLALRQFGPDPEHMLASGRTLAVVAVGIGTMVLVSLSRTRVAPFAVLIGACAGVLTAIVLGQGRADAASVLAASAWFALPQPFVPDFGGVTAGPLLSGVLGLIAMQATVAGTLVMTQRAAEAEWTRPDLPPIRRGLIANGIAVAASGLIGALPPGPGTAAVGLSIATGTLARRIVWVGAALLVLVALCPKLVTLFVLMPAAVRAAMLLYVAGFVMAQGCALATVRLLDTRRTLIIAFGLTAGIAVAIAPRAFFTLMPELASPLSFGALMAFLANVGSLPVVPRHATLELTLDQKAPRVAGDWFSAVAASWGLKPQTARSVGMALDELAHLLTGRRTPAVRMSARRLEDRVEMALNWAGEPLPNPARSAHYEDLLGDAQAQERFMMWMATREARHFAQRTTAQGNEARLVFED